MKFCPQSSHKHSDINETNRVNLASKERKSKFALILRIVCIKSQGIIGFSEIIRPPSSITTSTFFQPRMALIVGFGRAEFSPFVCTFWTVPSYTWAASQNMTRVPHLT